MKVVTDDSGREKSGLGDVLLHSDSGVVFSKALDEGWDAVEGGAVEGGGRFDGCLRGHVVFGPLEVAAWFYCSVLEKGMW